MVGQAEPRRRACEGVGVESAGQITVTAPTRGRACERLLRLAVRDCILAALILEEARERDVSVVRDERRPLEKDGMNPRPLRRVKACHVKGIGDKYGRDMQERLAQPRLSE